MNCRECRSLLDTWLDGDLDASTSASLQAHLDGCVACARHLAERGALAVRLQAAEDLAARRLRPFSPAGPLRTAPPSHRAFWRRVSLVAAAALVVAGGLLLLFPSRKHTEKPLPPEGVTAVIHVQDTLRNGDDAYITGRQQGTRFHIHVQVEVAANGQSG